MARQTKPLTVKEIEAAKPKSKEHKLFDGGGLYLAITPKGQKGWRLKYRFDGKECRLSLGVYPTVSLQEARKRRDQLKEEIAKGINPSQQRKEKKAKLQRTKEKAINTFEYVANEYFKKRNELNEAYKVRIVRAFNNDVFPLIGQKSIIDVLPKDIIEVVKRVESRGAVESAHRLFTQISKVFKYAVSNQLAERNPCSEMDKNEILQPHKRKNYPTITDSKQIKNLLLGIEEYTGDYLVKMALKLAPYVFVRPYNIRFAQWNEIDFGMRQWRIPTEKMKTKKEHIIPLTDSVLKILKEVQKFSGDATYIFHSLRSKTSPMSDATLNNALRRMGYSKDELVVHGFRAMFSTIAHEKSSFSHEVIETQLAHSVGSQVSQAYNRALYLDERVKLMQWWSDYLDEVRTDEAL